jgi:hypothetical protein
LRTPIVADQGEVGVVRRYIIDGEGRIVGVAPSDPGLEPAAAPGAGRIV